MFRNMNEFQEYLCHILPLSASQSMDKYSDKEHIISQLAEDPHGAHIQGETLTERTLPDLSILFMLKIYSPLNSINNFTLI